jgi:hypothetical protein
VAFDPHNSVEQQADVFLWLMADFGSKDQILSW